MKKRLIAFVLTLVFIFGLVGCGSSNQENGDNTQQGGATSMTMGTGGTAGTYYGYGGVLGQYIKKEAGITVNVVSTDGSKSPERVTIGIPHKGESPIDVSIDFPPSTAHILEPCPK